ncbi:Calcium channel flower [Halotydeus destructor]|nr:Calcium channel flower [Halotydeus destructor]
MMGSPMGDAQPLPGGAPSWWLESWKCHLAAALAVVEGLCGVITLISIMPTCWIGGALQVVAALIVLAIEAPTFVSFLRAAQPIGMFFEGKPNWMKAAAYVALAVIPCLPGCFGLFYFLGFFAGLGVAGIYGMLTLGRKAPLDQMRSQAGTQPYSPTSP